MTKTDIQLTENNMQSVVNDVLSDIPLICNKKRVTKSAEMFLQCGGGYDTESTTVTDENGKPLFAFVYHIQICINGRYMYFRNVEMTTKFFMLLCEAVRQYRTKKKQPKLIIWVANLAHEYAFIKRQLACVGITDCFAKSDRQPLKIVLQNCVELRECLGLFGSSLADVANKYTKTKKLKGDLNYDLVRVPNKTTLTETEYNYCKNDVVILDELSAVAFEKFTLQGLKIPMTNTGILRQKCKNAIKNIRAEYAANEKLMPLQEFDYYIMRRYMYAGGLSGTNIKYTGKKLHGVKCADVTSDYPAQINHNMFPSGQLKECKPEEIKLHKRQFRIFLFTCDMQAITTHAVLSHHKLLNFKNNYECPFTEQAQNVILNNGKIQYGENLCLMLNNTDIAALSELYTISNIKLYRTWYFTAKAKAPKFLLNCMNDDYLNKQALKAAGKSKTVLYKEYKIAVNSYYGMCATRLYDCLYGFSVYTDDIDEMPDTKTYEEKRRRMWLSPYIAYWCTSYARALLMHFIARYSDIIVQYDTDSLYYITDEKEIDVQQLRAFEKELRQYNRKKSLQNNTMFNNNPHFEDLGAFEIEPEIYTFKGLGAKRYLKQDENGNIIPVVAGMVKESFENYVNEKQIDAFELFDSDLTLNRVTSEKLASVYYDGVMTTAIIDGKEKKVPDLTAPDRIVKVTDYQGNIEAVKIGTYHALYAIEFSMKIAVFYEYLTEALQTEKALPEKYRHLQPIIDRLINQYERN